MSSGPRTAVEGNRCWVGVAPRVGYINGSKGATPPCHVGIFSGACSDCRRSLLTSPCNRQRIPLMEQLERLGGLFLDLAAALVCGGK